MVAKAPLVCVTKNRVNKGLREMLLSQLSTVQTDHHKPTYWFFFSLFLHGLPERLLLCLKNKMKQPPKKPNQKKTQKKPHQTNKQTNHQTHPNLYIHVVTTDPQQSTLMCNAGTGKPLQLSSGHPVVCAMWVLGAGQCQKAKDRWPNRQIILSISTLRSKAEVGTPSCDSHGPPQPCVKRSCTEAFNVTA